jgi:hypothetical protein
MSTPAPVGRYRPVAVAFFIVSASFNLDLDRFWRVDLSKKTRVVMSLLSGYVVIPRDLVIFDGTNYPNFDAFMCIHMCGLRLWGVLSGEVSCPLCPIAPTVPTLPMPPVLVADATQVAKDVAKSADDANIAAYDQKVQEYPDALDTYQVALTAYTQWMDDDAHAAVVLTANVLPQFAYEFMGLSTIVDMWSHLRQHN